MRVLIEDRAYLSSQVRSVAFSPDGLIQTTLDEDIGGSLGGDAVKLWDVGTGQISHGTHQTEQIFQASLPHSRRMGQNSPQGHGLTQLSCGRSQRKNISPHSQDIPAMSALWRSRQMEQNSLRDRLMAQYCYGMYLKASNYTQVNSTQIDKDRYTSFHPPINVGA